MSDVESAWEMERLVEGAVDISADDRDYYKRRSIVEEGDNRDSWALGAAPSVITSPGDFLLLGDLPPYRGV